MKKIRVAIIGCGKIFIRHVEAIKDNDKLFQLVAICDIDKKKLMTESKKYSVPGFLNYKEMLSTMKNKMDFVAICTPNNLHYRHAIDSIRSGYDVLIEKPVDFKSTRVMEILKYAKKYRRKAYCVLQVRYNPSLSVVKKALNKNLLGTIRSVSLIQRWQRPPSYFQSWRADINIGGRILYEVGIHYIDILQWLFGLPKIIATKTFKHKHTNIKFEDTVFSLSEYPNGASGSIEVTIASEPTNIECSISIEGSNGYVKIGGLALNKIETAQFVNKSLTKRWNKIVDSFPDSLVPNSYGTHLGSCPNHPTLYKEIGLHRGIKLEESINSIKFIESIYKKEL